MFSVKQQPGLEAIQADEPATEASDCGCGCGGDCSSKGKRNILLISVAVVLLAVGTWLLFRKKAT